MAKEKISGIYKITAKHNGKIYIGQSIDIYERWRGHWKQVNQGDSNYIHNAMRKYGKDGFIFEIIVDVIGEAIFESFDRSKSKKVNIIMCVLQYSFLIGLFLFLFFLAKNYAVEVGETRTIFYIVSGLLLLFVILFFVLLSIENLSFI